MSQPQMVIIEIDGDGVQAVYTDDPNVKVVIVDHGWDDESLVTCPFPSPAPMSRCEVGIKDAAEKVIDHPDQPQAIARS